MPLDDTDQQQGPVPLDQVRQQHPVYKDWSDQKLAEGLYRTYYQDKMSFDDFSKQVGYSPGLLLRGERALGLAAPAPEQQKSPAEPPATWLTPTHTYRAPSTTPTPTGDEQPAPRIEQPPPPPGTIGGRAQVPPPDERTPDWSWQLPGEPQARTIPGRPFTPDELAQRRAVQDTAATQQQQQELLRAHNLESQAQAQARQQYEKDLGQYRSDLADWQRTQAEHPLPADQRPPPPTPPTPPRGQPPQTLSPERQQYLEGVRQRHGIAAGEAVLGAIAEGYQASPPAFTTPEEEEKAKHLWGAEQWFPPGTGAGLVVPGAKALAGIAGGWNAAWAGAIRGAYEGIKSFGGSEEMARDAAAMIENLGLHGGPHVPLPEPGYAATARRAREEAFRPETWVHPEEAQQPRAGGPAQIAEQPLVHPTPPAGRPSYQGFDANGVFRGETTDPHAYPIPGAATYRPVTPQLQAPAAPRVPTPRGPSVETPSVIPLPSGQQALPAPAQPRVPTPQTRPVQTPPTIQLPDQTVEQQIRDMGSWWQRQPDDYKIQLADVAGLPHVAGADWNRMTPQEQRRIAQADANVRQGWLPKPFVPQTPEQQALKDQRLAIADEWDRLGDAGMARAVRAGANISETTPQGIAFLQQKLDERKAQLDPNASKPQQTFYINDFMQDKRAWPRFLQQSRGEASELPALVEQHVQRLINGMNQLGFTWQEAGQSFVPPNVSADAHRQAQALRKQMSEVLGSFDGYVGTTNDRTRAQHLQNLQQSLGTAKPPTIPEPASDIAAQLREMHNPDSTRDAVFVSKGGTIPPGAAGPGVLFAQRPEGTLITTNRQKAEAFRGAREINDDLMAQLLGHPQSKTDVMNDVAQGKSAFVVQAFDKQGNVVAESTATQDGLQATIDAVKKQAPDAEIRVNSPEDVARRREEQTGPQPPSSAPPAGWTEIGKNHIGQTLYEDPRGVRSYIENGVRYTEPVPMRPTPQGVQPIIREPDDKDPDFQVFRWHPSVQNPGPIEWPPVGQVEARHPEVMPGHPGNQMVRSPNGWIVGDNLGNLGQPYRPDLKPPTPPRDPNTDLAESVARMLESSRTNAPGVMAFSATELQNRAEQIFGGTLASGAYTRAQLYDAMELGVNRYIQNHPEEFAPIGNLADAHNDINALAALKQKLPTQTVRAGEKDLLQQFSTPPDYAYAITWIAHLNGDDLVLEPSAGTGSLAVHALNAGAEVIGNELAEGRRALLTHLLGENQVAGEDAEQIHNILPEAVKPTAVVMNPPFSRAGQRLGERMAKMTGARHIEQALMRLEPGGRLVAIVGRGMAMDSPTFRDWWRTIGSQYDVRANVGMGGDIYRKYGTAFETRVLVIDKVPPSGRPPVIGDVDNAHQLVDLLQGVRDARPPVARTAREPTEGKPTGPAVPPAGQRPGGPQPPVPRPTGPVGPRPGPGNVPPTGTQPPVAGGGGGPGGDVTGEAGGGGGAPGAPVAPVGPQPVPPGAGGRPAVPPGGGRGPAPGGVGGTRGGVQPGAGGPTVRPQLDINDPNYGAGNTFINKDAANDLAAQIRQMLGGGPAVEPMAEAFDPKLFALGAQLAAYHIEAGNTAWPNFSHAMIQQLGEGVRPYLNSWYEGARHFPGFEPATRMTPIDDIRDDDTPPPDPDDPDKPLDNDTVTTKEAVTDPENTELTESVYEPYKPQRINVPGAHEHPGPLVQSAAMASVLPPMPKYQLRLPADVISKGLLSEPQLEAVIYAGDAHSQMLPSAPGGTQFRRGFFIGDGTGVGKGREIAGVILDNFGQGRTKAVWISERGRLINDARRDWMGLGGKGDALTPLNKWKAGDPVNAPRGIVFTTYSTLRSSGRTTQGGRKGQSRIDQLVKWLGPDFDGVIAFDEAHNMSNAMDQGDDDKFGKTASQQALAGIELQNRLPNARILYVSATGATELSNLAYTTRLGLWGRGTAFPKQESFLSQMGHAGIAGMELVARDAKALGVYMARNLSFDGVEYDRLEHPLEPFQKQMYDRVAEAWQVVLKNMMEALGLTGAHMNPRVKAMIVSNFWSSHQRFFNQIITSMQMPTMIKSIEKDIAEGRQAVVQMVNTNEAAQERALSKLENLDDLEELDTSPFEQLMDIVRKSFPVQQFEEYVDDQGNIRTRPAEDAEGKPILNKEAVARRDKLLDDLSLIRKDIPDSPLDLLISHFGINKVAEVTGRKRRVVRKPDEHGEMRMQEDKRPASANAAEISAFQNAEKPVLVFSDAGSTGGSFHSDLASNSADNRRAHYVLQGGWRADKALQGLGRTHRTNQKTPPIVHLVTTDLHGQRRFISSIARRLAQLGALTKGERRTGDSGLFGMRDNLESREANYALQKFITDAVTGVLHPAGITRESLEDQMGLSLVDQDGKIKVPPMTRFLNRLLSLKVDMQNRVFEEFSRTLDDVIGRAAADGTLDTGVENYKAAKIVKKADQVVYTDPVSGAETRHVQLDVLNHNFPRPFSDVNTSQNVFGMPSYYAQSRRSGRIYAVHTSRPVTAKDGKVIPQLRLTGPNGFHFVPQEKIENSMGKDGNWTRLDGSQAKPLWDAEVHATPEFRRQDLHVITGAVLPIWDRLPGSPKVYRLQTDDGERMLGRVIPTREVNNMLSGLGAKTIQFQGQPADVVREVLAGNEAVLANGWKIKRALVAGEQRIELDGPGFSHRDELQQDGVFTERINYDTRFFIPTGSTAADVISRITEHRPIVDLGPPKGKRGAEPVGSDEEAELARVFPETGGGGGGEPPAPPVDQEAAELEPDENTEPALAPGTGAPASAAPKRTLAQPPARMNAAQQIRDYIYQAFAPTFRQGAQPMEYIIRRWGAELARYDAQAEHALRVAYDTVERLPERDRIAAATAYIEGRPQATPELQAAADALREVNDRLRDLIRGLGRGYLMRARENYMGQIWVNYKDWKSGHPTASPEQAAEEFRRGAMAKRPIKGSGAFLKQKYFEGLEDGMAAGLVPYSTNWIATALMKAHEMAKFYTGVRMADEIKRRVGVWVPIERQAEGRELGLVRLDDNSFHPLLPPAISHHFVAFDPSLRGPLRDLAKSLGVNLKEVVDNAMLRRLGPETAGFHVPGKKNRPPLIVVKLGGADTVLMHEIGHALDHKFGLKAHFQADPDAWKELGDLAMLRLPQGGKNSDPGLVGYVKAPGERIANLFHAYWHTPDLLHLVAPNAAARLGSFLSANQGLRDLIDKVKPSLQMASKTIDQYFPGMRDVGAWYAPEPAAMIFNGHVNTSYRGRELMQMGRAMNGAMSAMQLGLSGFHFTFETLDTLSSNLALSLEQASLGRPVSMMGTLTKLPIAPIQTFWAGRKFRNAYRDPNGADPFMTKVIDAYVRGGGRYSMDRWWQTTHGGSLITSWRQLVNQLIHPTTLPKEIMDMWRRQPGLKKALVPFQLVGRVLDTAAYPLMQWYVPTLKAGVAYNMIADHLRANPDATMAEIEHAMTDIIDRVDDRMGEMIHDNTFWTRWQKDLAQVIFRAFGWRTGTMRTLVGAFADVPKVVYRTKQQVPAGEPSGFGYYGLSRRTSYLIGMFAITVLASSILTYLNTGRRPKDLLDYVGFPPDGKDGRLSIPTYVKELFEWPHDPRQTFANQLNGVLSYLNDLSKNEGYFGQLIQHPGESWPLAALRHLWDVAHPISFRAQERLQKQGASTGQQVGAFLGIQPAPGYISHPEKATAWEHRNTLHKLKLEQRLRQRGLIP